MGSFFSSRAKPSGGSSSSEEEEKEEDSLVIKIHSEDSWRAHWTAHKDSNKLMVIDFSASWCGPCRFIEPVFKALAATYTDVVFVKIDVDELKDVSRTWKVQAMPTFVLVKGGKELGRVVGANKDELEGKIQQFKV